ncbi:hypothetical protein [Glaciimonas immobilis]|nr:hypothetical protein [Glaciimonas immobilis]KAF3999996.1 hypothetical protein HAV38_02130 [Glaciimonas immobilis]
MCTFTGATAADIKDVACRQTGAQAHAIAAERDQGKSLEEAIAIVRKAGAKVNANANVAAHVGDASDEKPIREMAVLLFRQFRQMSPDDAAFEFYMDCLDNV